MRALRDFNTPKIPANDIPVFLRLISDLFPGLELATNVDEVLKETAIKVSRKNGFQAEDVFVAKVRSRRFEVLRRLHAIDATRVHLTMPGVLFSSSLSRKHESRDSPVDVHTGRAISGTVGCPA